METYGAALPQLAHDTVEHLFVVVLLDGHTDVNLAGTDEVDDDTELVERAEDRREEAVRDVLAIRVHVQDDDVLLDRDRCRLPERTVFVRIWRGEGQGRLSG